jgi:hypothetical protein
MQSSLCDEHQLLEELAPSLASVEKHSIFESLDTIEQLRLFMEHHVFAVWDFMSLLKSLQSIIAPTSIPWMPSPHGNLVRLVNEIVLDEESDPLHSDEDNEVHYGSHFELYRTAMNEVGAKKDSIEEFLQVIVKEGLSAALNHEGVPEPSRIFMKETFALLNGGKAHEIAAAFAFGREHVIPKMFYSLLHKFGISEEKAPVFHYYLQRHIDLDGEEHGPAAVKLVTTLCQNDSSKLQEAMSAAKAALKSRQNFWDHLLVLLS